ncbi:MAG TPA: TIGR03118 family protein, partial [Pyrinomonadaceae bacterium]
MIRPLSRARRARKSVSIALALLFVLAFIPPPPHTTARAARVADDPQAQIPNIAPGSAYRQTNLLSDVPGLAPVLDPLLVNPWGISVRGTSPFWVANNGTSTTQLIRSATGGGDPIVLNASPQTINIPGGLPTGTVGNSTTDFQLTPPGGGTPAAASFIFDSITGNITAWNGASGATAQNVVSMPGHVWTGLAIGVSTTPAGNRLYAADFANNHIDVFNGTFTATTVSGGFIDATIPAGYAPYNIQAITVGMTTSLYVAYAQVGMDGLPVDGVGNGYVRKFNTDGVRDLSFAINNGALNSPWGLTIAPASFGIFGGALLVGNFGRGNPSIHAYNPSTGAFLGTLQNEDGVGIEIDELWALQFGNGGNGGDVNTLYFTAGPGNEEHGLFGKLNPTTATATSLIEFATDNFSVDEAGKFVDFTVIRTGDTSGTATINYNTFDESATDHANQKSDYEIALGTLSFAAGETSKTFRILIVDDKFDESDEVIELQLSNPTGTGVGLGSPNTAVVNILDNDNVAPTTNPIDDPTFFVRQHYL